MRERKGREGNGKERKGREEKGREEALIFSVHHLSSAWSRDSPLLKQDSVFLAFNMSATISAEQSG